MSIDIHKETIGYSAHVASMGIHTQGDTRDDLIHNINDAVQGWHDCFSLIQRPQPFVRLMDARRFSLNILA